MIAYRYNAGGPLGLPFSRAQLEQRSRHCSDVSPPILQEMKEASTRFGVSLTQIGRGSIGDPALAGSLRDGRTLREPTERRVRAYLASLAHDDLATALRRSAREGR